MRPSPAPSLICLLGCLGFGVSAWSDHVALGGLPGARRTGASPVDPLDLRSRWALDWRETFDDAVRARPERGGEGELLVLAYARMAVPECVELESRMGADAVVAEEMRAFVPLVVEVGVRRSELAERLGLDAAPLLLVLDRTGAVVDAIEPATGSRFEPFGFAAELRRARDGSTRLAALRRVHADAPDDPLHRLALAERLEARGAYSEADRLLREGLDLERRPNGLLHRVDRLRAAIRAHGSRPGVGAPGVPHDDNDVPADREGAIEAQLHLEDDSGLLYRGWSFLASVFADRVERARRDPGGTWRGVPVERWHRRLRDATRRAWRGAPERLVVAYGALIPTRYAGAAEDLDSADRMFCRAVVRSMTNRSGADSPRVLAASKALESIEQRR